LGDRKGIRPVKKLNGEVLAWLSICLEQGADLHMAQLMPLPLTVSCFSKIQIGFAFLVLAHPGSPGQRAIKWVCVCVEVITYTNIQQALTVTLTRVMCNWMGHVEQQPLAVPLIYDNRLA